MYVRRAIRPSAQITDRAYPVFMQRCFYMFHWLSVRLEVHAALEMIVRFVVCDSEASIGDTHRCLFESPNVLSLIQFKVVMK